jgi:hypothetical protein
MTPTLATLLGKAITPQMVALGASAMSATPPIPIFSGYVITFIKGAAIHHDGGQCGCVMWMCTPCFLGPLGRRLDRQTSSLKMCTCARVPALKDRYGARENMTQKGEHDKWRQREHDKKENE